MRNSILSCLSVAVVGYLLVCAILYVAQERMIFLPERLAADHRYSFPVDFEEVAWQVDGARLNGLHFPVADAKGVVLYLHGNAGSLRSWGMIATEFVGRGYAVLIPEYRGYGKSQSRLTGEKALHEDALGAYEFLRQQYRDDQIVVYGRSLGTGIAVRLAAARTPRMLILETPYFSLRELATRQFPLVPPFLLKYPLRTDLWIASVSSPIYLIHGTRDELIPYDSSTRLLPLIKTESELITVEGGGHNNLAAFAAYHDALDRILQ